jgi:hypothetical protein
MSPLARSNPVIFAVFDDAWRTDERRLRQLSEEARKVRNALQGMERAGKCEFVERFDPTPEDIFEVFSDPRFAERIAIFHFAGHANGYRLLLSKTQGIHAAGLWFVDQWSRKCV